MMTSISKRRRSGPFPCDTVARRRTGFSPRRRRGSRYDDPRHGGVTMRPAMSVGAAARPLYRVACGWRPTAQSLRQAGFPCRRSRCRRSRLSVMPTSTQRPLDDVAQGARCLSHPHRRKLYAGRQRHRTRRPTRCSRLPPAEMRTARGAEDRCCPEVGVPRFDNIGRRSEVRSGGGHRRVFRATVTTAGSSWRSARTAGSTCRSEPVHVCERPDARYASITRIKPDGSGLEFSRRRPATRWASTGTRREGALVHRQRARQ